MKLIVVIVSFVFLFGCQDGKDGTANDKPGFSKAGKSTVTTGAFLTVENSGVTCSFQKTTLISTCKALAGSEIATGYSEGVDELQWQEASIEGNSLREPCSYGDKRLTQTCIFSNAVLKDAVLTAEYKISDDQEANRTVLEEINIDPSELAPNTPINLKVTERTKSSLSLQWDISSDNANRFELSRSVDGTIFSNIHSISGSDTTFSDASLTATSKYYYKIKACNNSGCSENSPVVIEQTKMKNEWSPISTTGAPSARYDHTAVWTGSKVIIWGGEETGSVLKNDGGIYDPDTDSWTSISTTGAPTPRKWHTAVWTGSKMLVWGGNNGSTDVNSGGIYDPASDTWSSMTSTGAPAGKSAPAGVWTGSKMLVWGGFPRTTSAGGIYDPSSDSWTAMPTTNQPSPPRESFSFALKENHFFVWGGTDDSAQPIGNGGWLDTNTLTWTGATSTGAPTSRQDLGMASIDSKFLVWGGNDLDSNFFNDGAIYSSTSDTWSPISETGAPTPRSDFLAISNGKSVIIWGGDTSSSTQTNTGALYNATSDSWEIMAITNAPSARGDYSAVWTGKKMIVWGGRDSSSRFNTGGIYE